MNLATLIIIMINRIVKMTFQPGKVNDFLEIFKSEKEKIKAFEGCRHVELLHDIYQSNIFLPIASGNQKSIWKNTEILISLKLPGKKHRNVLTVSPKQGV